MLNQLSTEIGSTSTPNLEEFNPTIIPFQYEVLKMIRRDWDYNKGVVEILLSGSVGSAKSLLMAHVAVTHAMLYKRSNVILGRKALDDLKSTLHLKIIEHMEGVLEDGVDYEYNKTNGDFQFYNGSRFTSMSWADKNFKRFRSVEASAACIEELTENNDDYWPFYKEMRARVGRLPHVPESFVLNATNPASPSGQIYKYFMTAGVPSRFVFYSKTRDNPFLPPWYIDQLYETFDAREARRMLEGEWIEINTEVIYYAYSEQNEIEEFKPIPGYPIIWTWDFNIGIGKPLSSCFMQYIKGAFIIFDEVIIEGANTLQACEEAYERGLITRDFEYIINGDASGRARTTKSNKTDYQIIKEYLKENSIDHVIDVPLANPSVRARHVTMNGILKNSKGKSRLFVTKKCKVVREGLKLTALKKGSGYIEDEKRYQHVTTAIGYAVMRQLNSENLGKGYSELNM